MLPSDAENSSDSSTMAEKSATVAARIALCPTRLVGLPGVLEDRHDEAERGRGQRDDDAAPGC